jgi:acyl carrier protein
MVAAIAVQPAGLKHWSAQQLEDLVVSLLAGLLGKDRGRLRKELEASGSHLPVDSLDLFDVLVEFRQATGITLPKRKLKRHFMRSVRAFAEFAAAEGQP